MSTKLSIALGTCESDRETWQYNWQLLQNQVRKSHRKNSPPRKKTVGERTRSGQALQVTDSIQSI